MLLGLVPLITIALALTNEWHGLIWKQPQFERGAFGPIFTPTYGLWFWVYTSYAYLVFLIGSAVLVHQALGMWRVYRVRAGLILFGTALPWLSNVVMIFDGINPLPGLNWNSLFLGIAVLVTEHLLLA